jgi:NAD(P) transhydrogenase subunit beta
VALVIGANDVVNPARVPTSPPIYGMPILNVDQAADLSWSSAARARGYAGIENALFYQKNCDMLYGDALAVLNEMVQAVKALGE